MALVPAMTRLRVSWKESLEGFGAAPGLRSLQSIGGVKIRTHLRIDDNRHRWRFLHDQQC